MRRATILTLLAATLAACGGGDAGGPSPSAVEQCLRAKHVNVKENAVITTFKDAGIEHALVATFPGPNASALLLFAADDHRAKQALARIGQAFGATGALPIRRNGSVLVSWTADASKAGDAVIDRCLSAD